jgi:tetratricopeptide (TPR) repeat protein
VCCISLNRNDEALAAFEGALAQRGDFAPSLRGRLDALLALERYPEAVDAADAAAAAEPDSAALAADRAFALLKAHR